MNHWADRFLVFFVQIRIGRDSAGAVRRERQIFP